MYNIFCNESIKSDCLYGSLSKHNIINYYRVTSEDDKQHCLEWKDVKCFIKIFQWYQNVQNNKFKNYWTKSVRPDKKTTCMMKRFSNKWQSLDGLKIKTNYKYNGNNYIITPPVNQITNDYIRKLIILMNFDNDYKCFFFDNKKNTNKYMANKIYKSLQNSELLQRNLKSQLQGKNSLMRQLVIPPKLSKSLRCCVVPDPNLSVNSIAIPEHLFFLIFKNFNRNSYNTVILIKRDPVINRGSYIAVENVQPSTGSCCRLNPLWFTHMNLDIDGDCVSLQLINSKRALIETTMNMNPYMSMYKKNYSTALEFTQQQVFRMAYIKKVNNPIYNCILQNEFRKGFNTLHSLQNTLIALSIMFGSRTGMDFIKEVNDVIKSRKDLKYCITTDVHDPKFKTITECGAKGTPELYETMKKKFPVKTQAYSTQMHNYANTFINQSQSVSADGYALNQSYQFLQHLIIDYNENLILQTGNKDKRYLYIGKVDDYLPSEYIISPSIARFIDMLGN